MNEPIDVILTASKLSTKDYPVAHLTTQAVSMCYNASMLWYYNYQLGMAQAMGPGYMSVEQIQAMKLERLKHTVQLFAEGLGLMMAGICSLHDNK